SIPPVHEVVSASGIEVGAQNMYFEEKGAFTGEISPLMLQGLCAYVILGHSERRAYFGETDALIGKKLDRALAGGLRPILCVGEVLADREAGRETEVVDTQLKGALAGRDPDALVAAGLVIAYEPVWAIGTGKNARGADAEAMAQAIRASPRSLGWGTLADETPVLYGGSVTSGNIEEFLAEPGVDGALIGGASLKPDEMAGICARAGITARARGLAS
ncbi:MAG TPA: triose-phosphate isomerase, partial [Candidatus Limnocylindrales bacterium]